MLSHFSPARLFATLWIIAFQAPLSMWFSRQKYWCSLLCPPPRNFTDPGIKSESPALAGIFFTSIVIWDLKVHQFSSVTQSCSTLFYFMDCSTLGFPVHQRPELAQTHVHWIKDTIQPFHLLLSPSPPAFNLFHYQGLFKWVSSSHQMAKVLEFQLQHQSLQCTFTTDFL